MAEAEEVKSLNKDDIAKIVEQVVGSKDGELKKIPSLKWTSKLYRPDDLEKLQETPDINKWVRARSQPIDQDHVKSLARSMAADGQRTPIDVSIREDGSEILLAGRHRLQAALLINQDPTEFGAAGPLSLNARAFKRLTPWQEVQQAIVTNGSRRASPMDLASAIDMLRTPDDDGNQLPYSKVSERLVDLVGPDHKVTPGYCGTLHRLLELPVSFQNAVNCGDVTVQVASLLLRASDPKGKKDPGFTLPKEGPYSLADYAERYMKGEVSAQQIAQEIKDAKRSQGKIVPRGIRHIQTLLNESALLESPKAALLREFLKGNDVPMGQVRAIFSDDPDAFNWQPKVVGPDGEDLTNADPEVVEHDEDEGESPFVIEGD
jgi:hypothetical protein